MKPEIETNIIPKENNKTVPLRLLFLARPFPPKVSSGSVRTWNIARQLRKLGWDVTVVTPDPSLWRNTENFHAVNQELVSLGIERLVTDLDRKFLIPDEVHFPANKGLKLLARICVRLSKICGFDTFSGWEKPVLRACSHYKPGDFDVVLGTGMPFVTFVILKKIADRLQCPYVMDYRDAWSGNPHGVSNDRPSNFREEACLLEHSAAVTTVSYSIATLIGATFKCAAKTNVIMNGYDPSEFSLVSSMPSESFKVIYSGRLYPPINTLQPVFQALKIFLEKGGNGKFYYYGPSFIECEKNAIDAGVREHVIIEKPIERKEIIPIQATASINVVVTSIKKECDLGEAGIMTSKVFDCIALQKPILVVTPEATDIRKVIEVSGGGRCFNGTQVEQIADYFFQVLKGNLPTFKSPETFSWPQTALKLDQILKNVVKHKSLVRNH